MNVKFKFFLKIFTFWTVFMLFQHIFINLLFGDPILSKLPLTLILALLTGGLISLITIVTQKNSLKEMGISNPTLEDILPIQKSIVETSLDPICLIEKFHSNLFFSDKQISIKNNIVEIKTEWGDESGGELIQLRPIHNSKYLVTSKPRYVLTLLDGGRNYKHIQRIKALLQSEA